MLSFEVNFTQSCLCMRGWKSTADCDMIHNASIQVCYL